MNRDKKRRGKIVELYAKKGSGINLFYFEADNHVDHT